MKLPSARHGWRTRPGLDAEERPRPSCRPPVKVPSPGITSPARAQCTGGHPSPDIISGGTFEILTSPRTYHLSPHSTRMGIVGTET
ncbi:unnamed protein product [Nesidiocoris tenuis]|uniref:Uncharacterized protein n=1 Tax=Nesidiocoris tenuis TaxID=355587 RepID=A0A6H5GPK9_9HEMI|nr:unnamed protein product [Nesidiocoris tenuis]